MRSLVLALGFGAGSLFLAGCSGSPAGNQQRDTFAAKPGGPVLLVQNPGYAGTLRARVLFEGDASAARTIGAGL